MNRRYLTLLGRIEGEIEELGTIKDRINKAWERYNINNDELYLDSVALSLHDYYSSLENIFEMVANELDHSIPEGASWHKELLKQMTIKVRKIRPAFISKETEKKLDEYRGFRHIVRNVYSYNFSSDKISILIDNLEEVNERVIEEINDFLGFLESAAEM